MRGMPKEFHLQVSIVDETPSLMELTRLHQTNLQIAPMLWLKKCGPETFSGASPEPLSKVGLWNLSSKLPSLALPARHGYA